MPRSRAAPAHGRRSSFASFWELLLRGAAWLARPSGKVSRGAAIARNTARLQGRAETEWEAQYTATHCATWPCKQTRLKDWLRLASWGRCSSCHLLYSRKLVEKEHQDPEAAKADVTSQCKSCKGLLKNRIAPPNMNAIPAALRNLTGKQQASLRPMSLSQGTPKQHTRGYKRRDKLSALCWKPVRVSAAIAALPPEEQQGARQAFEWLMRCQNSACSAWVLAHDRFLQEQSRLGSNVDNDASGKKFQLSFAALLQPFVETALWPHLYPSKEFCESAMYASEDWRPFATGGACANASHESAKAQFTAKLTSGVADYAASYELLQFQFDRYVLRTIVGSQKTSTKAQADQANEHRHWCPNYWKRQHRHLLDLVRQLGLPNVFLTIAPWEFDFPWPYWVSRLHDVAGLGPTEMAGPETIAIAHAIHQVCSAYLAGFGPKKQWKTNLFSNKETGHNNVEAYIGRFEFQEGGQEHEYGKGRGSLHIHLLFWVKDLKASFIHREILAEFLHDDAELCCLALRVQRGISASTSRVDINEGPTRWNWSAQTKKWSLRVRHTTEYFSHKLRPCLQTVLRVLRCHSDIQWWDGSGALLRYVVGYVSKYNEAWDELALKEAPTAWGGALALLRNWRAGEAEMVMVLATEPMVFHNFSTKEYNPRFYGEPEDEELALYRRRASELESMSLLQWLRMHTVTGSLEDRTAKAQRRRGRGLVCVGVRYKNYTDDRFFWQWLLMNKPHRLFQELCPPEANLVNERDRCFARALLSCPDAWGSDDWVQAFYAQEGNKSMYVQSMLARARALRTLVRGQIAGTVPRDAHRPVLEPLSQDLSLKQQSFLELNLQDYELREAAAALEASDIQACARVRPHQPRFLDGGPGSGKTHCILKVIAAFLDKGLRALYATPTGKLAVTCRRMEGLLATTIHRAFGITKEDCSAWGNEALASFEIWIVDEISMVHPDFFNHIMRSWIQLARVPLLIFVGDFFQLPPIIKHGPLVDARSSKHWRTVLRHDLGGASSFRCKDNVLLNFQTLVRQRCPEVDELDTFCQGILIAPEITPEALRAIWQALPNVVMLTATAKTAETINRWALYTFGADYLGEVDVFSREENESPHTLQLFIGTRVKLNKTIDFDADLVNGAEGEVLALNEGGITLQMKATCQVATIWRTPRDFKANSGKIYRRSAYELGLAYATTVHQVEGQSLEEVGIVFEDFCPPGWAYTALTRARGRDRLRLIGFPQPSHFQPRLFMASYQRS